MPGKPIRILIVSSSRQEREKLRRLLSAGAESDYLFAEAGNAQQGTDLLHSFDPDCLLVDTAMTEAPGYMFLQQLSTQDRGNLPAVILLCDAIDSTFLKEAAQAGAQDCLLKSQVNESSLRRAVHNATEIARLRRELFAKERELEKLAAEDELTGLFNRRYFIQRLEQELARSHRYGTTCSLLMIDVDHFKQVNDTYGHSVGDQVLVTVGEILRSCLRSTDLAARYGGEEFCVLAANTDLEGGKLFAERIRRLLAERCFTPPGKPPFSITCSIGVAEVRPGVTAKQLIDRADEAMYEAKRQGRNRVVGFVPKPSQG